MRKVWVVVANSSYARIFQVENGQILTEKESLRHYESQMREMDLVSDKPGRNTSVHGSGPHPYQEPTPYKLKQRNIFADQIAALLEKALNEAAFERLYLIASAPFLGSLRESLSKRVYKTVQGEVDKDITILTPKEIREYLPPTL